MCLALSLGHGDLRAPDCLCVPTSHFAVELAHGRFPAKRFEECSDAKSSLVICASCASGDVGKCNNRPVGYTMTTEAKLENKAHQLTRNLEAYQNAVIKLPDGSAIDCIIYDVTDGGAVLLMVNPKVLPVSFQLLVPYTDILLDCRTCHFSGSRIAVKFVASGQSTSDS